MTKGRTPVYSITDEDGNELKGHARKLARDKQRREEIKNELKKAKEQKVEESETESIIEYQNVEQPQIELKTEPEEEEVIELPITQTLDEVEVSEEEIQEYIKKQNQKNDPTPSNQTGAPNLMTNITNTLLSTLITTLAPMIVLIGIQKFKPSPQALPQQLPIPSNSSNIQPPRQCVPTMEL